MTVAAEQSVHPALLATNALSEVPRHVYLRTRPVSNALVGLDYWDEQRHVVRRRLGVTVPSTLLRDASDANCSFQIEGVCHFVNERGRDAGRMHLFRNGGDGLRAMAGWLRVLELRLTEAVSGRESWARLPEPMRMTLIRYAYNAGPVPARRSASRVMSLVESGRDPAVVLRHSTGALRWAVIHAAQAWHLAGTGLGAPVTWSRAASSPRTREAYAI
jgi:hypothetical protein